MLVQSAFCIQSPLCLMESIIQIKSVSAITSVFNEQIIGVERCGIVVSALFAALSIAGKKFMRSYSVLRSFSQLEF